MRRKRFKHQAYIMCHMFRGWQLYNDYALLLDYGAGVLDIDVLSEKCVCDGESIETLSIVKALKSWLDDDLRQNHIPIEAIDSLKLQVKFKVSENTIKNPMNTLNSGFECYCTLTSNSDIYEESYLDDRKLYVKNAL